MKIQQVKIFLLIIFIATGTAACMQETGNDNSNTGITYYSESQGTTTSTSASETTVSGSAQFPAGTVVASLKGETVRGAVNYLLLRVYINGVFYGFLSPGGSFSFSNVSLANEYKVEIKNPKDMLLLVSISAASQHLITTSSTARALILEEARLSNSSLSISNILDTDENVVALVTKIETALKDPNILSSATALTTKSLFTTTDFLKSVNTGANVATNGKAPSVEDAFDYIESGDYDTALSSFNSILGQKEDEPTLKQVYNGLAWAYLKKKDLTTAKSNFEKAIKYKETLNEDSEIHVGLASILFTEGDFYRALGLLKKVSAGDPDFSFSPVHSLNVSNADVHAMLAIAHALTGNANGAGSQKVKAETIDSTKSGTYTDQIVESLTSLGY
ncbi:tetratricopeptide repeat protein [Candidatus Riflebacteria bacterium]